MLTKNDLLVLGFLLERPMHGYEINQAFKAEGIEIWFEISTASIYYSLNKLRRLDLIVETRSRGSSGEKTVYHITEQGREAFFAGMRDVLSSTELMHSEYDLGIFMLNRLPGAQALALLEKRIAFLRERVADLEQHHAEARARPLQQAILDHRLALTQVDIDWLTDITQQLQQGDDRDVAPQNLMTLQGNLEDFHLPDLVKLIASGKHNGTLSVTSDSILRTVTFKDGIPYCIRSSSADGVIIDPDQVLDDVYDLFRWQEGDFIFDQRGCQQEGCVVLPAMDVLDLIIAGARKLDNWDIIQCVVATSDAVFEQRREQQSAVPLRLRDEEQRILNMLDGFKDVTAVAREADLTEFETSKILYGLYATDLIQPADLDKSRLRRVFREFAELMCRSAIPYRATPDEATACEAEVNQCCASLPVRIIDGHIEDSTDPSMQAEELANIYRTFLQTQHTVLTRRLGKDIATKLRQDVLNRINPALRETLEQYKLV